MRTITSVGIILAAMLLMAVTGGVAQAQYPQPSGSVEVNAATSNVTVGGSVAITATVYDTYGDPVANESCALSIVSQPDTGASVSPASGETDANGAIEATVTVGSTPGFVVVRVICGDVAGSVTIVAGAAVTPAATPALGEAPASGVELPNTGGGGDAGSNSLGIRNGAVAVILSLLVGAQAVRMYRRRRA